ncbi:hypothetical protein DFH08DRAFT_816100 [Mycena albidolilacea]|uniref:Uncharacterized protein n=1 Tax=Mycena albidolilacea TaxID=1033008 RepID=A0AAD6ZLB0_9AGAR|nr:hypothetical protein DFH08DRAFT_816100 [Mycena albidolilacea]
MRQKTRAGCACIHSNSCEGSKSDSGKRPGTEERSNYVKAKVPTPSPRTETAEQASLLRDAPSDRATSGIVFVWHDTAQKTRPRTEIGKTSFRGHHSTNIVAQWGLASKRTVGVGERARHTAVRRRKEIESRMPDGSRLGIDDDEAMILGEKIVRISPSISAKIVGSPTKAELGTADVQRTLVMPGRRTRRHESNRRRERQKRKESCVWGRKRTSGRLCKHVITTPPPSAQPPQHLRMSVERARFQYHHICLIRTVQMRVRGTLRLVVRSSLNQAQISIAKLSAGMTFPNELGAKLQMIATPELSNAVKQYLGLRCTAKCDGLNPFRAPILLGKLATIAHRDMPCLNIGRRSARKQCNTNVHQRQKVILAKFTQNGEVDPTHPRHFVRSAIFVKLTTRNIDRMNQGWEMKQAQVKQTALLYITVPGLLNLVETLSAQFDPPNSPAGMRIVAFSVTEPLYPCTIPPGWLGCGLRVISSSLLIRSTTWAPDSEIWKRRRTLSN